MRMVEGRGCGRVLWLHFFEIVIVIWVGYIEYGNFYKYHGKVSIRGFYKYVLMKSKINESHKQYIFFYYRVLILMVYDDEILCKTFIIYFCLLDIASYKYWLIFTSTVKRFDLILTNS
jgi:hypothetical protein